MKTSKVEKADGKAALNLRSLAAKALAARKAAEAARRKARLAKARLKAARKALKAARKTARQARKEVKAAARALRATRKSPAVPPGKTARTSKPAKTAAKRIDQRGAASDPG
jgi:DNA invertase Pin-like site-specific DNA recombinase